MINFKENFFLEVYKSYPIQYLNYQNAFLGVGVIFINIVLHYGSNMILT